MKNKPKIEDSYNLVYYKKQLEEIDDKIKTLKTERLLYLQKIDAIEKKFDNIPPRGNLFRP
jgi:hypothetical protein